MARLAEDLRRAARADVETRARAVGVKAAVPLGVCLLPAFVLVGVVPLVAGSRRSCCSLSPRSRPVPLHIRRARRPVPRSAKRPS